MNTISVRLRNLALLMGALLIFAVPCQSDERHDTDQVQTPASAQAPLSAPSLLQVTGTANRFEISANHADVVSVLRAIFEQAHRQFAPDTSVTGDVSLVFTGQTFDVVLGAVCKQTFLRYTIDRNGIYQFQRDDQALLAAFARIRVLNSAIADQLRRLGFTVPPSVQGVQGGSGGFGGGQARGFAGGAANTNQNEEDSPKKSVRGSGSSAPVAAAPIVAPDADWRSLRMANGQESRRVGGSDVGNQAVQGSGSRTGASGLKGSAGPQGAAGRIQNGAITNVPLEPLTPYEQLLRDNGLVGIHAKRDQPVPIPDVLSQFSRQANVPILVDPGLLHEQMLGFFGNLVRPLPEALNYLLPTAHLEWRYVGNTIFVTEAPDFGIFYGTSNTPRAIYPPTGIQQASPNQSKTQQRSVNPQSNAPRPAKPTAKQDGN